METILAILLAPLVLGVYRAWAKEHHEYPYDRKRKRRK